MNIAINNYQGKAERLRQALKAGGHTVIDARGSYDVPLKALLIDTDAPVSHYQQTIKAAVSNGAKVYLYSHGAMPMLSWDGIWKPHPAITGYLAMNQGQKEVMEAYGYPNPIHVIGWHYSPIGKFQSCSDVKNVLFAPWHPHGTGYLHPARKAYNHRIHDKLCKLPVNLVVRHLGTLENNGITPNPKAHYIQGRADNSTKEIRAADVVVTVGTFAYLAIALGKPCVMFGQALHPFDGYDDNSITPVKSWNKYRRAMYYPHDWDGGCPAGVIEDAALNEPKAWKEKFIGKRINAKRFVTLLEDLINE